MSWLSAKPIIFEYGLSSLMVNANTLTKGVVGKDIQVPCALSIQDELVLELKIWLSFFSLLANSPLAEEMCISTSKTHC